MGLLLALAILSKVVGGLLVALIGQRNLLFLTVSLPLPSSFTVDLFKSPVSTTMPILFHFSGLFLCWF